MSARSSRGAISPARPFVIAALLTLAPTLGAQDSAQKQTHRETESLRRSLGDFDVDDAWIWGDWNVARGVAASSKKPIFLVFRCVP